MHNWDVRIQPLRPDTAPYWSLPYCAGSKRDNPPAGEPEFTPTCLRLHDGRGGAQFFYLDMGSKLFMPQAGSTDTIASTSDGGWALRRPDGHTLFFNQEGYLVEDRDRFRNGFSITYERTPLFQLYEHVCNPRELKKRGETRSSRRCAVLAYFMEDLGEPPRTIHRES